jgi:hypothetical protein
MAESSPSNPRSEATTPNSSTNISGGVTFNAGETSSLTGDVVGRDKIDVAGDIAGRDKIIQNIQNINERALTAAEVADRAKSIESRYLAEGVSALAQSLRKRADDALDSKATLFRGLLEYRLSDSTSFFGRDRAITDFMHHLQQGSLTVLHSESGAGKTSLLHAGIAPRLLAGGHLPVYVRPYDVDPVLKIKREFISDLSQAPLLEKVPLRDFLRQVGSVLGERAVLVVVIDQFEEFFTRIEENERERFVRELADCLDDTGLNVRWVLALRTEYFGHLATFRPLVRNPFENDYRLNRLTRDEAHEVAINPLAQHGLNFESDLLERILNDLGNTEVAPPQLQLVCAALYESLPAGETTITMPLYDSAGGAAGILRDHLERVLRRDLLPEQRDAARRLLESLITSEQQRVIRTHTELVADLTARGVTPQTLSVILSQLIDSRLIKAEETEHGIAYELAHDYLLDEIKLDPDVQARKAAQELIEQEVRTYRRYHTLLAADRLQVVEPYIADLHLTPEAQQLLDESFAAVQREREAEESRRQKELEDARKLAEAESARAEEQVRATARQRRLSVILGGVLVALVGLGILSTLLGAGYISQRDEIISEGQAKQATLAAENARLEATSAARNARATQIAQAAIVPLVWTTYKRPEDNFSIDLPPGWQQFDLRDGEVLSAQFAAIRAEDATVASMLEGYMRGFSGLDLIKFWGADLSPESLASLKTRIPLANMNVVRASLPNNDMSFDDYVQLNLKQLEQLNVQDLSHDHVHLPSGDAEKFQYDTQVQFFGITVPGSITTYIFINGGSGYAITMLAGSSQTEEYAPIFEEIARRFKLLDPASP